jgi:hypothetical protein
LRPSIGYQVCGFSWAKTLKNRGEKKEEEKALDLLHEDEPNNKKMHPISASRVLLAYESKPVLPFWRRMADGT